MLLLQSCFIDISNPYKLSCFRHHIVKIVFKSWLYTSIPHRDHKEVDLIDNYRSLHLTIREIHYLRCTQNVLQDKLNAILLQWTELCTCSPHPNLYVKAPNPQCDCI